METLLNLLKNSITNLFIKILMIAFIFCPGITFGQDLKITEFSIVTPYWKNQTNKDGTGIFFEIVKNVYEPKGIKIKYSFLSWRRSQMMVSSGQANAMLCVWKQDAIAQRQLIPHYPMFIEYTCAVFKKDCIKNWESIKSLNGKTALWIRDYDYDKSSYLKNTTFKQIGEVDNYTQAWDLIQKGKFDIYIDALIDLNQYIRKNRVDMTPYRLEILWGERVYISFSNTEKSKELIKIFDNQIILLHKSGKLKQIYDKWHINYPDEAWALVD